MYKKKIVILMGVAALSAMIAGCGAKGDKEALEYGNDFSVASESNAQVSDLLRAPEMGEVNLPDYRNLTVEMDEPEPTSVSEENLSTYIQMKLSEYPVDVTGRGVEKGDILTIDFHGTINGEEFEGNSATDAQMTIGTGEYLNDFEAVLYGKQAGDVCTAVVTFPEGYYESLAGKTADFEIAIKKVQEMPNLTKEFVAKHTKTGSVTIGDYYNELEAEYLTLLKNQYRLTAIQNGILNLSKQVKLDVSDEFREYMDNYYRQDFDQWLKNSDLTIDQYKSLYDVTDEQIEEDLQKTIDSNMPRFAILKYISDQEKLSVSDDDVVAYYEKYYGDTMDPEEIKELYGSQYDVMKMQVAVFNFMNEHINVVYKEPEPKTTAAETAEETTMEEEPTAEVVGIDTVTGETIETSEAEQKEESIAE